MEALKSEMTPEKWDEWQDIIKKQVCGICGNDLTIYTIPERAAMGVGCLTKEHHGFIERESYTQGFRRGAAVPVVIQGHIEKKMLKDQTDLNRAINLLSIRYPDAIKNTAQAALFITDCLRLGLDPLITPAEAVPIAFKTTVKEPGKRDAIYYTITMIITEDGWLSMAARGCPEEYAGPPRCMPLLDYLMSLPEHKERPLAELKELTTMTATNLCGDAAAYVWVAIGKRKGGIEAPAYGWFKKSEVQRTNSQNQPYTLRVPAAELPGNQARVRAIKRWVRENFPECRQKMMVVTAEWRDRALGIEEAQKLQQFIDAEYSVLIGPPHPALKIGVKIEQREEEPPLEEVPLISPESAGTVEAAAAASPPTTDQAQTGAAAEKVPEQKGEKPSEKVAPAGKLYIEQTWLAENLPKAKWSEPTAISWLKQFKVDTAGTLIEVLTRCSHEVQEKFVKEVQDRVSMA